MWTRRNLAWLGALAWAALLFWQSSSADGPGSLLDFLPAGSDKVAHAAAYAVLAGLATLATGSSRVGVLLAVLYGASDEIHQAFVPGRFPDVLDLLADAVGALLGAWLATRLVRNPWRRRRGPPIE